VCALKGGENRGGALVPNLVDLGEFAIAEMNPNRLVTGIPPSRSVIVADVARRSLAMFSSAHLIWGMMNIVNSPMATRRLGRDVGVSGELPGRAFLGAPIAHCARRRLHIVYSG